MKAPLTILMLLGLALALLAAPTTARAHGDHVQACLGSLAGAQAVVKSDLGTGFPGCLSRQGEIYLILRGGGPVQNEELRRHLWKVAGSLAESDWRPPLVQVRVVVQGPVSHD